MKHPIMIIKRVLFVFFLCLVTFPFAQAQNYGLIIDRIMLKDGRYVDGVIVEQIPGKIIRVLPLGKEDTMIFDFSEIESITRVIADTDVPQDEEGAMIEKYPLIKNPRTAFGLSAVFPGSGHFYTGEIGKGLLFSSGFIGGTALTIVGFLDDDGKSIGYVGGTVGIIVMLTSYIWGAIDAEKSCYRVSFKAYLDRQKRRPQPSPRQQNRIKMEVAPAPIVSTFGGGSTVGAGFNVRITL